jgi:hypothetical protein
MSAESTTFVFIVYGLCPKSIDCEMRLFLPSSHRPSHQKPRPHHPLALHFNLTALFKGERAFECVVHVFRNMNLPRFPVRFHPACRVHGVAPEVVGELRAQRPLFGVSISASSVTLRQMLPRAPAPILPKFDLRAIQQSFSQ